MIAFHEQHLRDSFPVMRKFRTIVDHVLTFRGWKGAGRAVSAVDIDRAHCATAVRCVTRFMTEMRDIYSRCRGGIHDGLPVGERYFLSVDIDGFAHLIPPLGPGGRRHRRAAP